jgi:hypothetical protein
MEVWNCGFDLGMGDSAWSFDGRASRMMLWDP